MIISRDFLLGLEIVRACELVAVLSVVVEVIDEVALRGAS